MEPCLDLRVIDLFTDANDVRSLHLSSADGSELPPCPPGSHIGLVWGRAQCNFYSLTNFDIQPRQYSLAVKRRAGGSGGSNWVHGLELGDAIRATYPRSNFAPISTARHHVLVSAGIGITPMIAHCRAHRTYGNSFEVWHVGDDDRLVAELRSIASNRLVTFSHRQAFWENFRPRLSSAPFGSHVYSCGPAGMVVEVEDQAIDAGWVPERIHSESFGATWRTGHPFTAIAGVSGRRIEVTAQSSLLEALDAAGIVVPRLCRSGVCGECATKVLSGRIDHRDSFLDAGARRSGTVMMPCVSRAMDSELELEI